MKKLILMLCVVLLSGCLSGQPSGLDELRNIGIRDGLEIGFFRSGASFTTVPRLQHLTPKKKKED